MTGYDLFALVVIVFSAMAGWVRGGAREIITFLSFILAALIALIGLPATGPVFRGIFDPDWVGTVLAAVVTFLAVYFGVRLVGAALGRSLRESALSGFDRALGVAFGSLRALILLGVVHLVVFASSTPNPPPGWLTRSAVYPLSDGAARLIQAILPDIGRAADQVAPVVIDSARRGATDQPQSLANEPPSETGHQP
ncbi:MAG: CvpA family protein [Caulobacterales bacterium]|nr:CvpA family protein [Caulobacterales bacterium]